MIQKLKNVRCLLFSVVLFMSCNTVKEFSQIQLLGEYQWHGIYGIASNITFNKDSTFIYNWQQGLFVGTTLGSWKLEGSILILNSERQPEEVKLFEINSYKTTN